MTEWIALIDMRWGWWVAGVLLAMAELVVPGVFLIWLALAAFLTGIVSLLIDTPLAAELAIFAIASVASIYAGRFLYAKVGETPPDPLLNKRAAQTIGKRVTICEPIVAGQGRATDGDSFWSARGPDMPVDAIARVVAMEGNVLVVEPIA